MHRNLNYLLQGSKWWLPHVWISTTYYTYLLRIPASSYTSTVGYIQLLVAVLHSSWVFLLVSVVCSSSEHSFTPINWPSPLEWCNFLNYVYNAYAHKWHKHIYISIDSTPWKSIIEMALWAIKKSVCQSKIKSWTFFWGQGEHESPGIITCVNWSDLHKQIIDDNKWLLQYENK